MNPLLVGLVFLGAIVVFVGLLIARWHGPLTFRWRIVRWVSAILVVLTGSYVWLYLHSLTIVTVTSNCPVYIGVVSAGDRHEALLRIGQTDYFAFIDPREGSVDVHGRNGVIASWGYVTSAFISEIDFSLDSSCKAVATTERW